MTFLYNEENQCFSMELNDIVFKGKHVIDYRYLAKFL